MRLLALALLLFLVTTSSTFAARQNIHLSAAASLTSVIRELATIYSADHPDVRFQFNFAPSGTLAKQIEQGAPADLFISANARWLNHLVTQGAIVADSVHTLAHNELVFVAANDPPISNLAELAGLETIALAGPATAPAGQYTEQALRRAGLLAELHDRLIAAKDVRQALVLADRGEVGGAFVYATDARLAQRAAVLFTVSSDLHDAIVYPAGLTKEGQKNPVVRDFFKFLRSEAAREVMQRHGFMLSAITDRQQ